jgi:hypothetical protein
LFAISLAMTAEAKPILTAVPFAQIESWAADDHAAALAAFQRSCDEILASGHGFERNVRFGGVGQTGWKFAKKPFMESRHDSF